MCRSVCIIELVECACLVSSVSSVNETVSESYPHEVSNVITVICNCKKVYVS